MRLFLARALALLVALQGVAGVAALTAGAYVLAGPGWALVVAGAFLVLGAAAQSAPTRRGDDS